MSSKVSEYLKKCFDEGITDHSEICQLAHNRLVEIDRELAKADELRIEKINLREILVGLGDESVKQSKTNQSSVVQYEETEETEALRKKICEVIEKHGPLTNREIISKVGSYQEDAKVIRAVKSLGVQEIIKRDKLQENRIIPGPNWNERNNLIVSKS